MLYVVFQVAFAAAFVFYMKLVTISLQSRSLYWLTVGEHFKQRI